MGIKIEIFSPVVVVSPVSSQITTAIFCCCLYLLPHLDERYSYV